MIKSSNMFLRALSKNLLNADRLEYQQLLQEACSVFDHPLGKEMIPNAQAKTTLVQLWTTPRCPISG